MQDDKPPSIFQKFFEELKLGNPIIILFVLTVLLLLGMVWVWQSISSPEFLIPKVIVHHPTSAAHSKELTAQAPQSTPTPTQAAFAPSRVAVATPRAESFAWHLPGPLAFLAGSFYEPHLFSR